MLLCVESLEKKEENFDSRSYSGNLSADQFTGFF